MLQCWLQLCAFCVGFRCMEKSSLLLEQTDDILQSSSHHARLLQAEQEKVCVALQLKWGSLPV